MVNAAGKMAKGVLGRPVFRPEAAIAVETVVRVIMIVCIAAEAICGALKGDRSP